MATRRSAFAVPVAGFAAALLARAEDLTVKLGAVQRAGEGIAGDISDSGEVVLVHNVDDERCERRGNEIRV